MPLPAIKHRRRCRRMPSFPPLIAEGFLEGLLDGLLEGLKSWVAGGKGFVFYDTENPMGLFDGLSCSGWFRLGFWCVLE